jgi:hypothetical protein
MKEDLPRADSLGSLKASGKFSLFSEPRLQTAHDMRFIPKWIGQMMAFTGSSLACKLGLPGLPLV